ncbi:MAG: hypothetical protein AMXMBFR13_21500 [Phycisphaerae bacterium]
MQQVFPGVVLTFLLMLLPASLAGAPPRAASRPAVEMSMEVERVWAGHPVGFCLLTHGQRQYVAYYDEQRRMTVAARDLSGDRWERVRLPSRVGWDSHNSIVMAVDDAGDLHLAGNMHGVPLVYFRTRRPGDIGSLERVEQMVGRDEQRVTYPRFLRGPENEGCPATPPTPPLKGGERVVASSGERVVASSGERIVGAPGERIAGAPGERVVAPPGERVVALSGEGVVAQPSEAEERVPGPPGERTALPGGRGALIFTYRDGGSGQGNQIYNVYDPQFKQWRRLMDTPLIDGEGQMNAYLDEPRRDASGVYHLCWVWRDTPDCATNHDVCYARSRNLVHWERSDGTPLRLPITYGTSEIVAPVPAGGGLINGNARMGFDAAGRPVVSYHRYDENGHTQVYNARLEAGRWRSRKVSDWDYRWEFSGGGSIPFEILVGAVGVDEQGRLTQAFSHPQAGSGRWVLDAHTLTPTAKLPREQRLPEGMSRPESRWPGMQVRWAEDSGESGEPGVRYVLRWETLPPNRDRPREGALPPASVLRVLRIRIRPSA